MTDKLIKYLRCVRLHDVGRRTPSIDRLAKHIFFLSMINFQPVIQWVQELFEHPDPPPWFLMEKYVARRRLFLPGKLR